MMSIEGTIDHILQLLIWQTKEDERIDFLGARFEACTYRGLQSTFKRLSAGMTPVPLAVDIRAHRFEREMDLIESCPFHEPQDILIQQPRLETFGSVEIEWKSTRDDGLHHLDEVLAVNKRVVLVKSETANPKTRVLVADLLQDIVRGACAH